jgi:pentatricopeptide repeat protein
VDWAHDNERRPTQDWAGPWSTMVTRSELTLKMLTHPDTGAIAAAATTSLPESLGGVRNWDYRYCWVRDASFVVQALHALGHSAEAQDFINFVQRAVRQGGEQDGGMRIMYGLHGSTELDEQDLDHLEGYRGSRPVRIGNAAAGQRQHDTYGELVDAVYELVRRGEQLEPDDLPFVSHIVSRACRSWREPDSGIWEMRGPEHHFVHSKVMAWVALDRGVRMSERWGMDGEVGKWRMEREHLRELILRRGYNRDLGAFTQAFGSDALDAAALRFPVQEFIAADHPMMRGTIDRVLERLTENGLVYRYRVDDGLPGEEGAFGLCTFWLVDALTLAGRLDEAWEIFEGMMVRANHLGLYSEQIDPRSGEFLGNFPQAFTHIGVINSALYLAQAEGRPLPERAGLVGTRERGGEGAGAETSRSTS